MENINGMYSIKEIYRTGRGPSSSHTMGPSFACERALSETVGAKHFEVRLFGSLVGCRAAISEEIGTDGTTVTVPLGEKTGLTRGKIKLFILDSLNDLTPVIGAEYTSIIKAN